MTVSVVLEVDRGVGLIRLDRPPANAVDLELAERLRDILLDVRTRDDIGAIVLWGGPKIFAAGADIKVMAEQSAAEVRPQVDALGEACDLLEALPVVAIAAVNGFALGAGLELAIACDLRLVAEDAQLGQPEIMIGVIPGAGGTQRLVPLIGAGRTRDLVYTGRRVRADEAMRIGLAEAVYPAEAVIEEAKALAVRLAAGPRLAFAAAKQSIRAAVVTPGPEGIAAERQRFLELFGTPDQREGMRAFIEKREPRFGAP